MIRAGATITPAPNSPRAALAALLNGSGRLTLDDLEALAFRYGGTVERNVVAGTYTLVGAVIDGRRISLGPVRS